jgi:hypothetical protein
MSQYAILAFSPSSQQSISIQKDINAANGNTKTPTIVASNQKAYASILIVLSLPLFRAHAIDQYYPQTLSPFTITQYCPGLDEGSCWRGSCGSCGSCWLEPHRSPGRGPVCCGAGTSGGGGVRFCGLRGLSGQYTGWFIGFPIHWAKVG